MSQNSFFAPNQLIKQMGEKIWTIYLNTKLLATTRKYK